MICSASFIEGQQCTGVIDAPGAFSAYTEDHGVTRGTPDDTIMNDNCLESLLVFTKYPKPGFVKTRLTTSHGRMGAANIHRKLTEKTLGTAVRFSQTKPVDLVIYYTGGSETLMKDWLGSGLSYKIQTGLDLGMRMDTAFSDQFAGGATAVVLIGVDCPDLSVRLLTDAFRALRLADVVLGPAADGGYYLIGLRRRIQALFRDIRWGTDGVFTQTMEIIDDLDLRYSHLEILHDVDRPDDVLRFPDLFSEYGGEIEDGFLFQIP